MWSVVVFSFVVQAVVGVNIKDAEHRLPRLFHVDDYARCLARSGALYCMGSFRLTPATSPHRMYDVMKKYSSSHYTFDRTLLHRGYCVTSRCTDANLNVTSPDDHARRFEACVQKWARPQQLTTRLETLHYCRSPDHRQLEIREAQQENSRHQLLLNIVYAVLTLNFIGTAYDLMLGDTNKNKLLMAWSVRMNWRRLVADCDANENLTVLKPVQGLRVILLLFVLSAHAGDIHYMLYTYNPQYLEWMVTHPLSLIVVHGSSAIQWFVMASSFLVAYHLLLISQHHKLSLSWLPKVILVRLTRIVPVYFVVLLFASSWWPMLRDGPVWQMIVKRESDICRRKIWSHMLFVNNYIEAENHCLIQNWFLAVDMQLYIFSAVVTLAISQFKLKPVPLLAKMFTASCCLNAVLAYIFKWKSLTTMTTPENLRTVYLNEKASFAGLYMSAWGSLPACILGLYVAHRHHHEQVDGNKIQHSWLLGFVYRFSVPLIFLWIILGKLLNDVNHPVLSAICIGIERPAITIIAAAVLYGFCKGFEGWLHPILSWHGFRVLARMSLSVLLLHWCLDMSIAAARPNLLYTTVFDIFVEVFAVWVYTYILAAPLTVLLEMPVYRSFCSLLI